METIFNIAGAIIASVGGAGLIIFGLSSYLGKVWANRLMEKEKADYSKELEKLKSEFTQDTEKYKLQLKKSELFFQKQYDASVAFGIFFYDLLPDKEDVTMELEDAYYKITYSFERYKMFCKDFLINNNILFDDTVNHLLASCQSVIQDYNDNKDVHEMHEGDEQEWEEERWIYGEKFYKKVQETYSKIKLSVVEQVKY